MENSEAKHFSVHFQLVMFSSIFAIDVTWQKVKAT
ncbi:hypothetical protein E2C01_086763 [Portunus trituberculatus]|uniref:WIF domain-containing protein n=1 Tax=Portunus trituberculatus TaxID=210409 RepID=A0A5B7JEC2_PORTR|nr:hypothetical protein [Portunus trituberculatus]